MASEFVLPDLGEGIHEAQIVQLLVNEGDDVSEDQPLMEVETDKAAVEIPSPQGGKIEKIHVEAGQTVNVGDVMVTFGDLAEAGDKKKEKEAKEEQEAAGDEDEGQEGKAKGKQKEPAKAERRRSEAQEEDEAGEDEGKSKQRERKEKTKPEEASPARAGRPAKVAASPAVRRKAKELGIDLSTIEGSGPAGRVTREDLESAAEGGQRPQKKRPAAEQPAAAAANEEPELPDFSKWGSVRRESISQIRKTIATQMVRSEAFNVHVTHHDLADIEMLDQLRKDHNVRRMENDPKLTLLPFVIKAIHAAMKRYPQFNASFDSTAREIIFKEYYNFGIAVDTPRGLVVPVIRDVDRKSIRDLATELTTMGENARQASFSIEDLRGGTFTITNIGSLGGIVATPIINYPELAILGLGKAEMKPVVREGQVVPRYMLPLNLSFDHRIIDGADAARFVGEIKGYLEVPGRLLLED